MSASASSSVRAADICERFKLSEEAQDCPPGDLLSPAYLAVLQERECFRDAAYFLSYLLPIREAAWWGCLCVWHLVRPQPTREADDALRTVFAWVQAPGEPARRAAEKAAEKAGTSAAGLLAQAVFCGSGSLSGPDLPAVPPPPYLGNTMVAGAIFSAVTAGPAETTRDRWANVLAWGADVAVGKNRWSVS